MEKGGGEQTRFAQRSLDDAQPGVRHLLSSLSFFKRGRGSGVPHDQPDVNVRSTPGQGGMACRDEVRLEEDDLVCVGREVGEDGGHEDRRGEDVHLQRGVRRVVESAW